MTYYNDPEFVHSVMKILSESLTQFNRHKYVSLNEIDCKIPMSSRAMKRHIHNDTSPPVYRNGNRVFFVRDELHHWFTSIEKGSVK